MASWDVKLDGSGGGWVSEDFCSRLEGQGLVWHKSSVPLMGVDIFLTSWRVSLPSTVSISFLNMRKPLDKTLVLLAMLIIIY